MTKKSGITVLILSTVCVLLLNLSNLIEYLNTGYIGGIFSNICFLLGDICILIGWILLIIEKKKNAK